MLEITPVTGFFAGITLLAVLSAAFTSDVRRSVLSLWVAGLTAGCLFLTVGAEFLALLQWIVSTVAAIGAMFFVVLFNEKGKERRIALKDELLHSVPAVLVGGAFCGVLWMGVRLAGNEFVAQPQEANDLAAVGRMLAERHLLSIEVLAITFFVGIVGVGTISRASERLGDRKDGETS